MNGFYDNSSTTWDVGEEEETARPTKEKKEGPVEEQFNLCLQKSIIRQDGGCFLFMKVLLSFWFK